MKNVSVVQKLAFSVASGLSFFAASAAHADLYMDFSANKTCLQTAPFEQTFTGGSFEVFLRDGLIIIDGSCVTQPQLVRFPPSALPPCPLGATGFIATGDVDRDGVRDDLQYWSLLNVIPAYYVEPYRPDLVLLSAAPASTLPRPLGLFRDDGVTSFYDIRGTTLQYDQSRYELVRPYEAGNGELARMNRDLPFGQYQYTYPSLGRPVKPLAIPVTITPLVDPFQPTTKERTGFRVTSGFWTGGSMELDPRVINKISWQGNTRTSVTPGVDRLLFGIYNATDTAITFPPSGNLTIPNPLTTFYNIPPFFYNVGDTGIGRFTFARNRALNSISYDVSQRQYKFGIRFIDTYAGFTAITYPLGTSFLRTAPSGDYDSDGNANLLEYAYGSDVLGRSFVLPSTTAAPTAFTVTNLAGNFKQLNFPTNSTAFPALPNILQRSTNGGTTWVNEVVPGPNWVVNPSAVGTTQLTSTAAITSTLVKFRLTTTANSPLTAGNFTVANIGGDIQRVTITKRANVGASLTYGFERKNGVFWQAEVLPTVVGASNARWTLVTNDATQLVAESVIAIPTPPTEFRPAVKQNY